MSASDPETAEIERIARAMCEADGLDPDEDIVGGQATGFENFGPLWQAEERSEGQLGLTNYVRLARAAIAASPKPASDTAVSAAVEGLTSKDAFRRGAEAMQRSLADALRDHLNSRAAAIANSLPIPEYQP